MKKDPSMINSGYDRLENDAYFTIEEWCTRAIMETIYAPKERTLVWEPACGLGHMSKVIQEYGFPVHNTDIVNRGYEDEVIDFTSTTEGIGNHIITNPPYEKAECEAFVRHALKLMAAGEVATISMLLRNEWDSASTRTDIFSDNKFFAAKVVLLGRPRWFEKRENDSSPRHNYSWFHWSAAHPYNCHGPLIKYYKKK